MTCYKSFLCVFLHLFSAIPWTNVFHSDQSCLDYWCVFTNISSPTYMFGLVVATLCKGVTITSTAQNLTPISQCFKYTLSQFTPYKLTFQKHPYLAHSNVLNMLKKDTLLMHTINDHCRFPTPVVPTDLCLKN